MTNHRNPKRPVLPMTSTSNLFSQDDAENIFYQDLSSGNFPVDKNGEQSTPCSPRKPRACKKIPVTVTTFVRHSKHSNGRKMINEYVKEKRINQGSYGKVVLYRNINSGTPYAIKVICKSRLRKFRITGSETAMADVLREVSILKTLEHPNIINLVEVIDDQKSDYLYMVLEYVESSTVSNILETKGRIDETTARRYFKDVIAGLIYLHHHNIVHGDIKPENILVTTSGGVKIVDFSFGHAFETYNKLFLFRNYNLQDDNDELLRCPGTPAFIAPECCSDTVYHGKAADIWAVGVTLYSMVLGFCPFLADSVPETCDKIVNSPLPLPEELDSELKDLLQGLLCKDPMQRITLDDVAKHPWVVKEGGPVPVDCLCSCR
ncbi:PREDICTED: serine/threonine-protein kinase GRIK1-like isoform X3 [Populus euphratica]|uniref:non-specific serine/threonine protein kinase n=1 Tax=Populus euphratica TaxID=75702 RepID=A0AAJ6XNM8_POPEU|nr:PREDICTED: serine/threonine-protein kinase GRIK1-like isoform X2 [Populus euphratica]XP_011025194.1 PREDICTED: serine/threonine-protein kinase GRIK1-like isoform X3 [Populus euphratica]